MSATDAEPVLDLVWTPDSAHLGPRPKTFLPLRRVAATLGKVSHKKFGRLRLVPKSGLSAELLVAITRLAGNPARSRVFLIDAAGAPETSDPSAGLGLLLLPAEIVPASASPDPTRRWLAFLSHSTTTSSAA